MGILPRQCGISSVVTETGLAGRVVQDVVTQPTRKWARVQCAGGAIEWRANQERDYLLLEF